LTSQKLWAIELGCESKKSKQRELGMRSNETLQHNRSLPGNQRDLRSQIDELTGGGVRGAGTWPGAVSQLAAQRTYSEGVTLGRKLFARRVNPKKYSRKGQNSGRHFLSSKGISLGRS